MKKQFLIYILLLLSSLVHASSNTKKSDLVKETEYKINFIQSINESQHVKFSERFIDELMLWETVLQQHIKSNQSFDKNDRLLRTHAEWVKLIQEFRPNFSAKVPLHDSSNFKTTSGSAEISGRVINHFNGEPIGNVKVQAIALREDYTSSTTTYTLPDGSYYFSNLDSQYDYVVKTTAVGYEDIGYPNISCESELGCQNEDLTPIELGVFGAVSGIDFQLPQLGKISGHVFGDEGSGLSSIVKIYNENKELVNSGFTNLDGFYELEIDTPGSYYVLFVASGGIAELYDNFQCIPECDFSQVTPLTISQYHLNLNSTYLEYIKPLSGRVFDTLTGNPLTGNDRTTLLIFDSKTNQLETFYRLPSSQKYWQVYYYPGTYYLLIRKDDYLAQYADNQNCQGNAIDSCDLSILNPTEYIHDQNDGLSGIDFPMVPAGKISGHVFLSDYDGTYDGEVILFGADGIEIDRNEVDATGQYDFSGLANGTYYVATEVEFSHNTAYPNYTCTLNEVQIDGCQDVLNSTPINLTSYQNFENIDIEMLPASVISGVVTDDQGVPIQSARVKVFLKKNDGGVISISYDYTNSSGEFSVEGLFPGTYYLIINKDDSYYTELYEDVPCIGSNYTCDKDLATPIEITSTSNYGGYQISLSEMPELEVNLNRSGYISIYHNDGSLYGQFYSGNLFRKRLPAGEYRLLYTYDSEPYNLYSRYISKVYGSGNCYQNCVISQGNLIQLEDGQSLSITMNIDDSFRLDITTNLNQSSFMHFYEDDVLLNETRKSIYNGGSIFLNVAGPVKIGLHKSGFYNHFYDGINCLPGNCNLSQVNELSIVPNSNQSVHFALQPLEPFNSISGQVSNDQGPMEHHLVELIQLPRNPSNSIVTSTDVNGYYNLEDLDAGEYHVFARPPGDQNPYANMLYNNYACFDYDRCDTSGATILNISGGEDVQDIDFNLPSTGSLKINQIRYPDGEIPSGTRIRLYKLVNGQYQYHSSGYANSQTGEANIDYLYDGNYKIMATQEIRGAGYIKTVYPDISCSNLDQQTCLSLGTDVDIDFNQEKLINEFIIDQPAIIDIKVVDAISNEPINNVYVKLVNSFGYHRGAFTTYGGMTSLIVTHKEPLFLVAEPTQNSGYKKQIYIDIVCEFDENCDPTIGTPIETAFGERQSITVALHRQPQLSIKVIDEFTLKSVESSIKLFHLYGHHFNSYTSENGVFDINVPVGQYYLLANGESKYSIAAYPNAICTSSYLDNCEVSYQPIEVLSDGSSNYSISLTLNRGVSGYVIDAETGEGLSGIELEILGSSHPYDSIFTTSNGGFSYYPRRHFYKNSYVATNLVQPTDYYDEVYDNFRCFEGSVANGLCHQSNGILVDFDPMEVILIELDKDLISSNGFEYP